MKKSARSPKRYKLSAPEPLALSESYDNEYAVQLLVQSCHNLIWEKQGYDPARAFDEFSKLLFAKFCDERHNRGTPVFRLRSGEDPHSFAVRVGNLFSRFAARPEFRDVFESRYLDRHDVKIDLDDITIAAVAQKLSGLRVTGLISSTGSPEIKGTVYEKFIGSTFRGELGQFFTHRELVTFMIEFLDVRPDEAIYDPACGSGGFLVQAIRFIREKYLRREHSQVELEKAAFEYSSSHIFGTDINERAARTAKLNILMHGGSHSGIHRMNALLADEQAPEGFASSIRPGHIDVILANPPFAGYERDPNVLSRFHLGMNGNGAPTSVTREVLFIERIVTMLKTGGRAGIVIPQGIFTNRKLASTREFLKANAKILAVIELPDWAFIPSGTSVRGSILFLERSTRVPVNYSVFMKRVEHIGFTSTGRPDAENELEETVREYRRKDKRFLVPISDISTRLDAKFYQADHRDIIDIFSGEGKYPLIELEKVGRFTSSSVNPKGDPEREYLCIETGDVEPDTYKVTPKAIRGGSVSYASFRPVQEGDILISRRRPYRGAITMVPKELGGALAITEFSVFRPNVEYVPIYVLECLRSPSFVKLMTIYSTGEMSGRISESDLRKLRIPIPPREEQERIAGILTEKRMLLADCMSKVDLVRQEVKEIIEGVIRGS